MQRTDQGQGENPSPSKPAKVPQVRCPSCGQFLFQILSATGDFTIQIKCKAGGCKKLLTVRTSGETFAVEIAA